MKDIFTNPRILEAGESLIPIGESHLHFPAPVSPSRVQHCIREGFAGVRLGTVTIGRLRYTSKEEILRFLLAQQNPSDPVHTKIPVSSKRQSSATMTSDEVDSELRRFGFNDKS